MFFDAQQREEIIRELRETLKVYPVSVEELSAAEEELHRFMDAFEKIDLASIVFAEQLNQRQGSRPPNFDELYRRKAEMDRQLLDPENPESK